MSARVFCKFGRLKGIKADLSDEMIVGRAKSCQIELPHKMVSSKHARIYRDKERSCYMIEDLGSLNGTLLDGTRITEPERLGHLHMLNFGGSSDFFFIDPEQIPAVAGRAPQPPPQEIPKPAAVMEQPQEEVTDSRKTFAGPAFAPTPAILAKAGNESDEAKTDTHQTWSGAKPAAVPDILARKLEEKPKAKEPKESELKPEADLAPCLVITNWKEKHVIFPLKEGENIIGRASDLPM